MGTTPHECVATILAVTYHISLLTGNSSSTLFLCQSSRESGP